MTNPFLEAMEMQRFANAANERPTAREAAPYLKTLRRLPAHVVLEIAGGDLLLGSAPSCVCGLAYRTALAYATRTSLERVRIPNLLETTYDACAQVFGGTSLEWHHIFYGVVDHRMPAIEYAFVTRLQECL
jgi:hypothetical protein